MRALLLVALHLIFVHGPDNQQVFLNVDEISSIREPRAVTERVISKDINCIVFMTNGKFIGTIESCEDIVKKVEEIGKAKERLEQEEKPKQMALIFIRLTGSDGAIVDLNPAEIVAMREPRPQGKRIVHQTVNCLIFTADGKFIGVREHCNEVRKLIEDHEAPP